MFLGAGSGELFEDIVRHGSHNIFWCYGFERDVAQYKKIKSNNKTNEMSYTSFYLRRCFTSTQMNIKRDEDGLLPILEAYWRFTNMSECLDIFIGNP